MAPLIRLRRLMSRARIWGFALLFVFSLSATDVKAAIPGDVGGAAGIDISDALWTLRYVVGLIPAGTTGYLSADVSPLDSVTRLPKGGDGVTIADALAILRRVVNLDTWYSPASCLNGTAAAGAPIIGSVTIKDSSIPAATRTVPIAADGKYTVDVNGMTAPYMVRADGYVGGNEYHLYSAGTSADMGGTINVTPLTDLIVANIAGTVADDYFNSDNFSGLTAEQLTAQSNALKEKLLPVLQAVGVSDSIDLLRASFSTDHTALDAALDVIRVTTDTATGVATITNIVNQQQMTSNVTTGTYTGALDNTTGVAAAVSDIQAISAGFETFSNLFANGLPSESNPTLLGLFDEATFMQEGMNLAAFLSEITTDPGMVGISFDNISIQSMDTTNGTAVVAFDVIQHGMVMNDGPRPFHMIKKNGVWYMQGDRRIAQVEVEPEANYNLSDSFSQIATGLRLDIEDRGGRGITSAVVTGAGLPVGGVILINNIAYEDFQIEGQQYGGDFYSMDDTAIAGIADSGEIYTVELYTHGVLSATYTEKLKKRPYLSSELSSASFPAISQQTLDQMQSFTGGNATVNWTLPAGLINDWLSVGLGDNEGNTAMFEAGLLPTETSKSFTLDPVTSSGPFTPTYGWIWLGAWDSFGRQLATSVSGSSGSQQQPVQNDSYVWIEGSVYASAGHTTPIAGAVVSTDLDSQTATTDASGHFFLQTTTPANYSTTPYTISITKSGYPDFSQTWNWGDHPAGQTFNMDGTFGI